MSILNLLPDNAERSGSILWQGRDLLQASLPELQTCAARTSPVSSRTRCLAEPGVHRRRQLCEPLIKHWAVAAGQALARAEELLVEVGMPEPKRRLHSYPHEMSGGQQQRVMIAMALACEPKLLIADEPTTALDVTIQRQILELVAKLKDKHRMSVLFISHDLGVVGEIADHVVVMRHGVIREQAPVAGIFARPQDAYTKALLACRPSLTENPARLMVIDDHISGKAAAPSREGQGPGRTGGAGGALAGQELLPQAGPVRQARVQGRAGRELQAAQGAHAGRGRRVGLGQDDDGPDPAAPARAHRRRGDLRRQGPAEISDRERQLMRRRIQVVFQNPYASLNPRFTIGQTLVEPMEIHGIGKRPGRARAACTHPAREGGPGRERLRQVPARVLRRPAPAGGDRALPDAEPDVLVLDEAVSALDVSVQAQVLNLLKDLQDEFGLSYVFISHDLAVVRFISDEVLVMKDGRVVEQAERRADPGSAARGVHAAPAGGDPARLPAVGAHAGGRPPGRARPALAYGGQRRLGQM
jgi:peptide/nickel transport system ATP-binding protein